MKSSCAKNPDSAAPVVAGVHGRRRPDHHRGSVGESRRNEPGGRGCLRLGPGGTDRQARRHALLSRTLPPGRTLRERCCGRRRNPQLGGSAESQVRKDHSVPFDGISIDG
ncbi:MAG: hypothetical protein MZV70_76225 [Desulfobacterales bacterium]|nr:hypothetical protein [Desulfobacterales bacterium]